MAKYILFTKDIGDYKAGDYSSVEEPVAKQFIDMKIAEAAPDDPIARTVAMSQRQVMASIQAEFQKQQEEQKANAKALAVRERDFARPRHIVSPHSWRDEESEVDKRRGPGDWFRCIMRTILSGDQDARAQLERPWEEGGYGCYRVNGSGERNMVEGVGGLGGYTTPVIYESQVFDVAAEQSVLVSRAESRPLAARQVEWPALDQYKAPPAGQAAWFGGMQVFRKGEITQRTERDLGFKKVQMLANDLTAYTELSRDLVMDSTVPIDSYVVRMMGEAIGWREDWEAFNGSGVNQFLGILNSPAALSTTRHTVAQIAALVAANAAFQCNPITFLDVFAMKVRMLLWARDPVWFCHPYTYQNLLTLQDPTARFLFVPHTTSVGPPPSMAGGGITYKPAGYLLGDPLFLTEKVPGPSASTNTTTSVYGPLGELVYVDCKSYWVGRRSGLEVGLSEHFKFDTDQLAIRAKIRNDGRPGQLAPIYLGDPLATGTKQVSGIVTLAQGVTGP